MLQNCERGRLMIRIKNLTKKYKDFTVFEGVTLDIQDGEIYGLVGVSGVGKSTLLGCLNGLETFAEGSIQIDDICVEQLNWKELREFRKNVGMIFQNFSLISRKTVFQNIAFPMECWGYDKKKIHENVLRLAKLVQIEDKLTARPGSLSGGQKQRVAIARALALNPKYILCDECTSALDPKTTNSILELLKSINKEFGITIVVVTHEMSVIKRICQKIAIMEDGNIVESGSVEQIFRDQPQGLLNLTGEEKKQDMGGQQTLLEIDEEELEGVTVYLKEQNIRYKKVKKKDILC